MTTWQDQQPMSRRALRESERAHAQAVLSDSGDVDSPESGSDQQIWPRDSFAEPLDYTTQVRQPGTPPVTPLRRPRPSAADQPATESASYRLRDFSPESRGSSFSSTQPAPWTPPSAGSEDLNYHTSVGVERPGQSGYSAPISTPPVVVTPEEVPAARAEAPAAPHAVPTEHTLTRRQLRELRNAASPADPVEAIETAPPAQLPQEFKPAQNAELSAAIAEFDAMLQARNAPPLVEPPAPERTRTPVPREVPAAADPPGAADRLEVPRPEQRVEPPSAEERVAAPSPDERLAAPANRTPSPPDSTVTPIPPAMPESFAAPAPVAVFAPDAPGADAMRTEAPAPTARPVVAPLPEPPVSTPPAAGAPEVPAEPLREVISAPEVYAAPAGHWSNQFGIDEKAQKARGPHKRDLAASDAITTSALVLPAFPASGPITGPISGTGQLLMTGSIELPRSLGISGLHPSRYDRADIDSIIDAGDREDAAPDSAPVRAVRAVSTYTSSQGIIQTKKPRGNNLPMVLSITAGVMMIGVVVLVVAGMIFKIF